MLVLNRGKTVHSDFNSLDPMKKACIVTSVCIHKLLLTHCVFKRETLSLLSPCRLVSSANTFLRALDREQPAVKTGPLYLLMFWETKIQVSDYKATTILRAYFT